MNRFAYRRLFACYLLVISTAVDALQDTSNKTSGNFISERYDVGEELFFSAQVDRFELGDVYTINTEDGIFIDLDSYLVAIDFQIEITDFLTYQGWYISEEQTFDLRRDANNKFFVKTNKVERSLTENEIQIINDLVYLSPRLINELFQIGHEFIEASLTLKLFPEQKLPVQLKKERQNRRIYNGQQRAVAKYPELWRGYEFLSPQSLDLSLNSTYIDNSKTWSSGYSLIGGREIAYHNARFFLNGNDNETLSNARLLFSKNLDISSSFKNPIVKAIEFGDVDKVSVGSSAFRSNTVGLVLTNVPTIRELNDARTTTLSGEIQEGWDVELYRNEILIDRLNEVNTGRYIFPDVALFLGENNFEIVLYGPQGQVRRLTQDEYVNTNVSTNNDLQYKSSITKLDSTLLPVSNRASLLESDLYDWSTQVSQRISDSASLSGGLSLQSGDDAINQLTIGVNSSLSSRVLASASYAIDDNKNHSLTASLRSSIFGHDINLSYSGSKNELSDLFNHSFRFNNRGMLSLISQRLTYQNTIKVSRAPDATRFEIANAIGMKVGSGNLSNSMRYLGERDESADNNKKRQFSGNLNYRLGIGSIATRFGMGYGESIDKKFSINNYSLDFSWSPTEAIRSRFEVNYTATTDDWDTRFNLGYRADNFIFSSFIANSSLLGMRFGLSARLSVGGEPFNQGVFLSERNLSRQGTVVVRTFVDANANAIFDDGDSTISGVEVKSIQSISRGTSDENGLAVLKGLAVNRKTDIEIQANSIEEPFLKPILAGVSILPRESLIDYIDYPLVYVSDIDGTINTNDYSFDNVKRVLQVRLLNEKSEVVSTTSAEFDGYFFFSEIPPGNYKIDIDKTSLAQNKLKLQTASKVKVSNVSELITVSDITVSPIQFNTGYRVELAKLSSLPLLKVYWQKIRGVDIDLFANLPVFYVQQENKYSLNIGFYESLETAQQFCQILSKYPLACSIEEYSSPKS